MAELCPLCRNQHEVIRLEYGGIPFRSCPEVPENVIVPLVKFPPCTIYAATGEVISQFERYGLAGFSPKEGI